MTEEKTRRCTACGEVKPWAEFYLRSRAKPVPRSECKACEKARQRRGVTERTRKVRAIVDHYASPSAPLTPEVEAVIYTSAPLNPVLVALAEERRRKAAARQAKRPRQFPHGPLGLPWLDPAEMAHVAQ
jgi:hypothetical protein